VLSIYREFGNSNQQNFLHSVLIVLPFSGEVQQNTPKNMWIIYIIFTPFTSRP
jgi:hypothetical protein